MTVREKVLTVAWVPVWLTAATGWVFWAGVGLGVQAVLPREEG